MKTYRLLKISQTSCGYIVEHWSFTGGWEPFCMNDPYYGDLLMVFNHESEAREFAESRLKKNSMLLYR